MQYFLSFRLGWFPIIYNLSATGWDWFRSVFLPVMALSFGPIAGMARFLRGELLETLNSDFMLLARTKGLTRVQATIRHAFRNSCVPLVGMFVGAFTSILGGSLVVERIFSIPGVGGIMIDSISAMDHPLTIACIIFYTTISLFSILIVDILYGVVDPRIRMGARR
jgi:oligopeptide transport system permease protein